MFIKPRLIAISFFNLNLTKPYSNYLTKLRIQIILHDGTTNNGTLRDQRNIVASKQPGKYHKSDNWQIYNNTNMKMVWTSDRKTLLHLTQIRNIRHYQVQNTASTIRKPRTSWVPPGSEETSWRLHYAHQYASIPAIRCGSHWNGQKHKMRISYLQTEFSL